MFTSFFAISVTFGMTSNTMFYYTRVMNGLFEGAEDVSQVQKFWTVRMNLDSKQKRYFTGHLSVSAEIERYFIK